MSETYRFESHFLSVGCAAEQAHEFEEIANQAVSEGDPVPCYDGYYLVAADADGAEIWFGMNQDGEVREIDPYFRGKGCMLSGLAGVVNDEPLQALIQAWAAPSNLNEATSGLYPYFATVLDSGWLESFPMIVDLSIAVFPDVLTVYESPEAFTSENSDAEDGVSLDVKEFFALDLIQDDDAPRRGVAHLIGIVSESRAFAGKWGRPYGWCLVSTLGGTVDVLFDMGVVQTLPAPGAVLQVEGWLSTTLAGRGHPVT